MEYVNYRIISFLFANQALNQSSNDWSDIPTSPCLNAELVFSFCFPPDLIYRITFLESRECGKNLLKIEARIFLQCLVSNG